ncbi:hypothetical protein Tco_0923381 [Tanacetum coccineum]|uniref:Uncharacterized protein n=1 Tax=Tanacetum coccineum TaxID=301880 RepID=A0ABQ5D2D0_9ASTR
MLVTAVGWWRCRWLRGGSGSEVVLMMVTTVVGRMLWCRRGGVQRWGWCCSGMEMVETKVRVAVVVWRGGGEGQCMAWWCGGHGGKEDEMVRRSRWDGGGGCTVMVAVVAMVGGEEGAWRRVV